MNKTGFDFIAPVYDGLVKLVFGNALRTAQLHFIPQLPASGNLLLLGGGTGWLLNELLTQTAFNKIVYVESSAEMLRLSQELTAHLPNINLVEFRLGTERDLYPTETFDVIITPFLLDLFSAPTLNNLVKTVYPHLRVNGYWLVTDFVPPAGNGFKAFAQKILLKSMYLFFGVMSNVKAKELPDWEKSLSNGCLDPQKSAYFYGNLIKSVLYQKYAL